MRYGSYVGLGVMLLACQPVLAEAPTGWSVETELFVNQQAEPAWRFSTYFDTPRSVIFDVAFADAQTSVSGAHEVTIFDMEHRNFELLQPARRLRCTLEGEQIMRLMADMEVMAARMKPIVKFAAHPKFVVSFDEDRGTIKLQDERMSYLIEASGTMTDRVRPYLDFADWSARLGAVHPGGLPPAARIYANRELRLRQLMPLRVERTTRDNDVTSKIISRHRFRDEMSDSDRRVIEDIKSLREQSTLVDVVQYFQSLAKPAAVSAAD